MTWKEILVYAVFIAVTIFICFYFMDRQDFDTALDITADEQAYVFKELKRRAAGDCVLTQTDYGWRCEEMATGKVFKVKI
jgi:hypothetical protein